MAVNMWKDNLKNVESDNNKILYKTLLDFFYSETVLTFWISLVFFHQKTEDPVCNSFSRNSHSTHHNKTN